MSTEGRNFLNFDHRGSSSPGHGEELTACGRPPFPLSVSTDWGNFLSIDHRGSSAAGDAPELARRRRPPGVDKGAHPLMFIPALAACTAKRMKTEGFRTLRVLPPGSAARGKTRKTLAEMDCIHFCETKKAPPHGGTVLTPAEAKFRGGGAAPLLV